MTEQIAQTGSGKTAVIVGAGPGLGIHTAEAFGRLGFKVVLLSRRAEVLQGYAAKLQAKGIEADFKAVDCADLQALHKTMTELAENENVELMLYNTAVLKDGLPSKLTPDELVSRFTVDVAGALCAAQAVLPKMQEQGRGTLLFTGGGFALYPLAQYCSISVNKAALRVLVQTLSEEVKEQGIYCGILNVCDVIGGSDKYSPETLAQLFVELYQKRDGVELTY